MINEMLHMYWDQNRIKHCIKKKDAILSYTFIIRFKLAIL